jgi:hypothetical protein
VKAIPKFTAMLTRITPSERGTFLQDAPQIVITSHGQAASFIQYCTSPNCTSLHEIGSDEVRLEESPGMHVANNKKLILLYFIATCITRITQNN